MNHSWYKWIDSLCYCLGNQIRCGKGWQLLLKDVLYVPDAKLHLISVGCLGDLGFKTIFTTTDCHVRKGMHTIAQGTWHGASLYSLNGNAMIEHLHVAWVAPDLATWHRHLGHISYCSIINMAKKNLVQGMPTNLSTLPPACEHCVFGKQTKMPVPKVGEGVMIQLLTLLELCS